MNERELRAFVLIADVRRMDRAARELGYSQPAVSYQIQRLEQCLGTRLFVRDSTGTRLTREGEMILPTVRALLMLMDNVRDVAQSGRGGVEAA